MAEAHKDKERNEWSGMTRGADEPTAKWGHPRVFLGQHPHRKVEQLIAVVPALPVRRRDREFVSASQTCSLFNESFFLVNIFLFQEYLRIISSSLKDAARIRQQLAVLWTAKL